MQEHSATYTHIHTWQEVSIVRNDQYGARKKGRKKERKCVYVCVTGTPHTNIENIHRKHYKPL